MIARHLFDKNNIKLKEGKRIDIPEVEFVNCYQILSEV